MIPKAMRHHSRSRNRKRRRGFSTIETVVVILIAMVLTALAVPQINGELKILRLNSAAMSVAGVISTTRYQAIMHGYKYNLTFDNTTLKYQIKNMAPPATTFSNVGTSVQFTGTNAITLSAKTTLQFNPSGTVQATTGAMTFNLTYAGQTKTITVSNIGDVTITP